MWAWNQKVRYRGGKEKLIVATRESIQKGRTWQALLTVWQCLLLFPSSLAEPAWLRLFVKAHLGSLLSARLRQLGTKATR